MPLIGSDGKLRYPTRAEARHDEAELAKAILEGAQARPDQAFGEYFQGHRTQRAIRQTGSLAALQQPALKSRRLGVFLCRTLGVAHPNGVFSPEGAP